MSKFWLLIPAVADLGMTILNYIALNFLSGSVYQILKGGSVATTLFFSICILKSKINRFQIIGCIFSLLGIAVVGITHYFFKIDSNQS
jgi:drug/metabolite transporter (DMT)-like permease